MPGQSPRRRKRRTKGRAQQVFLPAQRSALAPPGETRPHIPCSVEALDKRRGPFLSQCLLARLFTRPRPLVQRITGLASVPGGGKCSYDQPSQCGSAQNNFDLLSISQPNPAQASCAPRQIRIAQAFRFLSLLFFHFPLPRSSRSLGGRAGKLLLAHRPGRQSSYWCRLSDFSPSPAFPIASCQPHLHHEAGSVLDCLRLQVPAVAALGHHKESPSKIHDRRPGRHHSKFCAQDRLLYHAGDHGGQGKLAALLFTCSPAFPDFCCSTCARGEVVDRSKAYAAMPCLGKCCLC